jgi:1,4-dihydroxy-6-naphthoate synthase
VDHGEWWAEQTGGLPLPLGANSIHRRLGPQVTADVSALLRESIQHGLDHLDEAVQWLLARGGPLDTPERVRQYLGMYANQRTLDYGDAGRDGIRVFFERAVEAGMVDRMPALDYAP